MWKVHRGFPYRLSERLESNIEHHGTVVCTIARPLFEGLFQKHRSRKTIRV